MYVNLVENIIELTCSKIDLNANEEHGIQLLFEGQNELDYFLVQRIYDFDSDYGDYASAFYTEGCDTIGYWTYIEATLKPTYVQFSVDKLPIRIHLPELPKNKYVELRQTLDLALRYLGRFTDEGCR